MSGSAPSPNPEALPDHPFDAVAPQYLAGPGMPAHPAENYDLKLVIQVSLFQPEHPALVRLQKLEVVAVAQVETIRYQHAAMPLPLRGLHYHHQRYS